jgi:uncharacterized protein
MSAQEDAELVRRGFEAFIAGDMEWMNEHLDENIVWHVPGNNQFSGAHRGRDAVLAFFANSVAVALPEFDIHDIVASEDHVVALLNVNWKRNDTGATFQGQAVTVFHVANGQALETWTMNGNQPGLDEFLG